ncbi:auxin-responsive protein SAUR50-like [Papaver somniferum]|uniref:auxin-responsive protein SAUR50-like n=1 Tax=Papaver somniferum TaxID=3469 RepID=UPI000E6FA183|nr:auxin-responsive protein SAUR50-like [Papaver somniferum]
MFKLIIEKFVLPSAKRQAVYEDNVPVDKEKMKAMKLPFDVKKGQFAVFATEGDVGNRFIVELDCLSNNPAFLILLEKAEQEFGFRQGGILGLPCKPDELKRALGSSISSRRQ